MSLSSQAWASDFEKIGYAPIVGAWDCSAPEVMRNDTSTDLEISIIYRADGTNTVDMRLEQREDWGTMGTLFRAQNHYRVESNTMIEKEISTKVLELSMLGEEISEDDPLFLEFETSMREDEGSVMELELTLVSKDKIIIDEATDNVVCTRRTEA